MHLYRVLEKQNSILNQEKRGWNFFDYDEDVKYLHFFILPEHAEIYQKVMYKNTDSYVMQVDIPYHVISPHFGLGKYMWYFPDEASYFLEVRIPLSEFKTEYIKVVRNNVSLKWKNPHIYKRYLNNMVYDNQKVIYEHYFPFEDLRNEKIEVLDYPKGSYKRFK